MLSKLLAFARRHMWPMVGLAITAILWSYGVVTGAQNVASTHVNGTQLQLIAGALFLISVLAILFHWDQHHYVGVGAGGANRGKFPPIPQLSDFENKLELVEGKLFSRCEVLLDGKKHLNCTFEHVTFVCNGEPYILRNSNIGPFAIKTENPKLYSLLQLIVHTGMIRGDVGIIDAKSQMVVGEFREKAHNRDKPSTDAKAAE